MRLGSGLSLALHHRMRSYYVAVCAGLVLIVSAFLPWIRVGETSVTGIPEAAGLWVVALGLAAVTLASLSIYTRKNSRHPLLLVGLVALGIFFLAYNWMERTAREQAWARSQAIAIVDHVAASSPPETDVGIGIYAGMAASIALVLFGLTIVVKKAGSPYAPPEDDDV